MRNILALVLVVALLAGCVGGGETTDSGVAAPETPSGGEAAASTPAGGVDLTDMAYLELAALGQPVECDVTTTMNEQTFVMNLKIHGDKTRMEMAVPDIGDILTIQRGNKYYSDVSGPMGQYYLMNTGDLECDWFESIAEESEGAPYDMGDLEEVPSTDMDCSIGTFSSSVFDTPGTVCTTQDLQDAMMEAYGV